MYRFFRKFPTLRKIRTYMGTDFGSEKLKNDEIFMKWYNVTD